MTDGARSCGAARAVELLLVAFDDRHGLTDVSPNGDRFLPVHGRVQARLRGVPTITSETLANGLPLHRVALPGTRAVTILVAFDAGARTERPEENGMAHFLEHLVFKGGEKYDHYKKVNETAERMGGSLNAYTSHDLVAFHITVRAEAALEAIDLLTDFVGRPLLDADELDRERGVVIQEIQRYKDQPSAVAEELIDKRRVRRPPAGPHGPGPGGAPAHVQPRGDRRLPRAPLGRRARRRVHRRQHRPRARQRRGRRAVPALPDARRARAPTSPRRRCSSRRSSSAATPTSRTCG